MLSKFHLTTPFGLDRLLALDDFAYICSSQLRNRTAKTNFVNVRNLELQKAEIKACKGQARKFWASGKYSTALSKLSICDDRELYSYARKETKKNTKHGLPEKTNWLKTEGSESAWLEFFASKERLVSLVTNPHLFDARMELIRLLGLSKACSLLHSIVNDQPEAVVLLIRESELYLDDDWAQPLQSLSLPKEYAKHSEVWSRLKTNVDHAEAAIAEHKTALSTLTFAEVAVASQNWIARNIDNPFRVDFEIELAYRIQHELLRELEISSAASGDELQTEIEVLQKANYSRLVVDQWMYLSYQYSDFKTGVLELYSFGDIAISESPQLAIIESPKPYQNWRANGFRYKDMQRRFDPGEIKKASGLFTHEATKLELFLKEEGVPEEIVIGKVKLNRIAVVAFLTTLKLKSKVSQGFEGRGYTRAISVASIPNIFQRFYSFEAEGEDQSMVFTQGQAAALLDLLSSNTKYRRSGSLSVLLPFFRIDKDNYLVSPSLISQIDWALLLRDLVPSQNVKTERCMAMGVEYSIKTMLSMQKCEILNPKDFREQSTPGDIDVLVDFGKHVLAIQVKRPRFRLSLKEQRMEYYHSDIKAAKQVLDAAGGLKGYSVLQGKTIEPLVVSASCEGLGEISNSGVNKISLYDLNLFLEDEKNREWNQIQYGLEMLNETYASRARLESPLEGVRVIPIPKLHN